MAKKLFYIDKPIIGLDIDNTGVKAMAIDSKRWLVLGYNSLDLNPLKMKDSFDNNSTYLEENLKLLFANKVVGVFNSNHVAIALPTARSYSRTFKLPTKVERNLRDAIDLEIEQYIPVPASTLYTDFQIIERDKNELTVLMTAITRNIVDRCVAAAENAGLVVSLVEPSMSSVARLVAKTEEGELPTIIVDIGPANTDIAIIDRGTIRVTSGLSVGGNTFTLDIARKLGIPLENAHQLKVLNGLNAGSRQTKIQNAIEPSLRKITTEIRKVIRYYQDRVTDDRQLEQLLIVGSGSNMPGIGEYFTNELVIAARVASPWQKLDFGKLPEPPRQLRSRYLTVAGLSIVDPEVIWE